MLPRPQLRKNGGVAAFDGVAARSEHVGDLALMDKYRRLRFAHNQLRTVLDFLIPHRKAIHHRVAGVVEPFNDFDKLCARAEPVKNSHVILISLAFSASVLYAERRTNVQESEAAASVRGCCVLRC